MTRGRRLPDRTLKFILHHGLFGPGEPILAAVSGGPDSVALLHLLVHLRATLKTGPITVLHFDHQTRGHASREDSRFVASLAESLQLPFCLGSEDVAEYGRRLGLSFEMAARACRHRFFQEARRRHPGSKIALGHTANDQAEEVLLRLVRGTGPAGLAAMPPKTSDGLVRPLLFATREEIQDYLTLHNQETRTDTSNADLSHQRNVIRREILPLLARHFHPRVVEVLAGHANLVRDEETCWEDWLERHWPDFVVSSSMNHVLLDHAALRRLAPGLLRRVLRRALGSLRGSCHGIFSRHVEALCRLAAGRAPRAVVSLPGGVSGRIDDRGLLLRLQEIPCSLSGRPGCCEVILEEPGFHTIPGGHLSISLLDGPLPFGMPPLPPGPHVALMDAARISWPLKVRTRKPGDRFQPLGLKGTKKLQDYFVDAKVPESSRDRVPLLCDREKICWVVGHRLDERVKVTPRTERILVVEKGSDRVEPLMDA